MTRFLLLLLLLPHSASAQAPPSPRLTDQAIIEHLSRRFRWDWFWNGFTHPNYTEGKSIPVAVLESSDETAVFFADLGEYVVFDSNGRITDGRAFPPTTNAAAMNEYLRTYGDSPAPPGQPGQPRSDPRTIEEKKAAMRERAFSLRLPRLEPPDYILSQQAPPGLAQFQAAVRAQTDYWYDASCGMGQLVIPYFSPDDTVVYVYAELGTCGTGIFDFHLLSNGQWQLGRFWPHVAPGSTSNLPNADDWSHTIQQILAHRLATIPIP